MAPTEQLHPQIQTILDQMSAAPRPESVEEARAGYVRTSLIWVGEAEQVADVSEEDVGRDLRAALHARASPSGAILWIHGGGWIMGNLTSYDPLCRALANATGAVVASVDYRLAPESQFPGPVEDCEAALRWLAARHAASRWRSPATAPAGTSRRSSRGARATRRAGLRFQLLVYPAVDAACATGSYQSFGADDAFGLDREQMLTCWAAYAPGGGAALARRLAAARR